MLREKAEDLHRKSMGAVPVPEKCGPEEDEDGFCRFQLWHLMYQLGHGFIMGFEPPFDLNIELELEDGQEFEAASEFMEECSRLKKKVKVLTEQNIELSSKLLNYDSNHKSSVNYYYNLGFTEGRKSGNRNMEHKRAKMQSQRDQLAKALSNIVGLTPAECRKAFIKQNNEDKE